jgi:uncharacterized Zn finger protein
VRGIARPFRSTYGVGARLDNDPEMLFQLRDVDHMDLIGQAAEGAHLDAALAGNQTGSLDHDDLGELFGIDIEAGDVEGASAKTAVAQADSKTSRTRAAGSRSVKKTRSKKTSTTRATSATKKKAAKKKAAKKKRPKQEVAKKKSAKKK